MYIYFIYLGLFYRYYVCASQFQNDSYVDCGLAKFITSHTSFRPRSHVASLFCLCLFMSIQFDRPIDVRNGWSFFFFFEVILHFIAMIILEISDFILALLLSLPI